MRIATLLLLGMALAGCASTDAAQESPVVVAAPPAPAVTEEAKPVPPAPPRGAPRGGRQAAAPRPAPAPEDDGPITREKIAGQCWMKAEANNARLSLDKRVEFVDKCVAEGLKAQR